MFKIGTALVSAVIAALVAIIAGLVSGARIPTVFLRAFFTFLAACGVVWFALFVLEKKNVVAFDRDFLLQDEAPTDEEMEALAAEAEAGGEEGEAAETPPSSEAPEDADGAEGAGEEETPAFQPLSTDGLKHMDTAGGA